MPNKRKTRETFQKLQGTQRSDLYIPAVLGDRDGVVKGAKRGYVWVRLPNGQNMQVRNSKVPSIPRLPVLLGFEPTRPGLLQVLASRDIYTDDAGFDLPSHGETHTWPDYDTVYIKDEQILSLLAYPSGTWIVTVVGKLLPWLDGRTYVEFLDQTVDLSSYVLSSGARWVLLQGDASGIVTVKAGETKVSKELLLKSDIPAVDADHITVCAVMMYAGQRMLNKTRRQNDFRDLRSGIGRGLGTLEGVMLKSVYDTNDNGAVNNAEALGGLPIQQPITVAVGDFLRWDGTKLVPVNDAVRRFIKIVPPTADDDASAGYQKTDIWLDQANGVFYECLDNTDGSAVWQDRSGGGAGQPEFSVDGALVVATNVCRAIVFTRPTTIEEWYIYCKAPGSSGSTIADINLIRAGSALGTIFTTSANRPTLAYNDANGWAVGVPDVVSFLAGDILTLDIDQKATGAADLALFGKASTETAAPFDLHVDDGETTVTNVSQVTVEGASVDIVSAGHAKIIVPAPPTQIEFLKWDTVGTVTDGVGQNHNVSVNHQYQEQIITVDRPILLTSVKWWIRSTHTYRLSIREAYLSSIAAGLLSTTASYDSGDTFHTFDLSSSSIAIRPGNYAFRLSTDDGSPLPWEDFVTDENRFYCKAFHSSYPVIYGTSEVDQGSKADGAFAPLSLTYYDSLFEVVTP